MYKLQEMWKAQYAASQTDSVANHSTTGGTVKTRESKGSSREERIFDVSICSSAILVQMAKFYAGEEAVDIGGHHTGQSLGWIS